MLLPQIKAIVESLTVIQPGNTAPGYLFGTAKEINNSADNQTVWPVICHYPMSAVDISLSKNGSADDWYNLYLEFLYKTEFGESSEDNEPLVTEALSLANRFLVAMRSYKAGPNEPAFFKFNDGDKARAMPCFNRHDVNTVGVGLTFRVKKRVDEYLIDC